MADLGAIGRQSMAVATRPAKVVSGAVVLPDWESSVPFRRRIALYRRSTGVLVRTGYTGIDGSFTVASNDSIHDEQHFVIAFDADGEASYNALIYDFVTPATSE